IKLSCEKTAARTKLMALVENLTRYYAELQALDPQRSAGTPDWEAAQDALVPVQRQLDDVDVELDATDMMLQYLEAVRKVVGRHGVPSVLVGKALPLLSHYSDLLVREMTDSLIR